MNPASTPINASLALASTNRLSSSTTVGTIELFATAYVRDSTRAPNAAGNSSRLCTTDAIARQISTRPTHDSTIINRRPPLMRSMAGPRKGATTANGVIVSSSDSATRPRAAWGPMSKNSEPARATVTNASPAVDSAWVTASRENGDGPNPLFISRARVGCATTKRYVRARSRKPATASAPSVARTPTSGVTAT